MLLEGLVLGLLWRRRSRGIPIAELAVNLLAGISLLMAAVTVALGVSGPWIPLCLAAALVAHLADLRLRWQAPRSTTIAHARSSNP